MKKEKRAFGKLLMVLAIIFFYMPIVYMVVYSFNDGKSLTAFSGFSLRWYRHMLESRDMMTALYTTFGIAVAATLISTVIGTISAIGLSKSGKIVRKVMDQVNNFPMMNPEIVTAIGFIRCLSRFRWKRDMSPCCLHTLRFVFLMSCFRLCRKFVRWTRTLPTRQWIWARLHGRRLRRSLFRRLRLGLFPARSLRLRCRLTILSFRTL